MAGYDARCDFNKDGVVDELDDAIILAAYHSRPGDPNWNPACDLDGDGRVTGADYSIFIDNFGYAFSVKIETRTEREYREYLEEQERLAQQASAAQALAETKPAFKWTPAWIGLIILGLLLLRR